MKTVEGNLNGAGHKIAVVASRFNRPIVERLLQGASETFKRHGVAEDDCQIFWVPGSFEVPLIAKKLAQSKKFDSILCLGAVIRGETPHFDFVAGEAASGITQSSLETGIPIIFSILTTNTLEQAQDRCQLKGNNAGSKGALAAIEMVNLIKGLVT